MRLIRNTKVVRNSLLLSYCLIGVVLFSITTADGWSLQSAQVLQSLEKRLGSASDVVSDARELDDSPEKSEFTAAPMGLPALQIPENNPQTIEKIELGKRLYFDTRLSGDSSVSCATCHDPNRGWTDRRSTSSGIDGQVGGRNAPTIINAAYHRSQFWDGRAGSLEEQALGPIENPIEMGAALDDVVETLKSVPEYRRRFELAFGTEVTREGIGRAIAAFERTILSGNSPYDQYLAGDESALSNSQKRGLDVFMEKADCAMCHSPPIFSNGRFYNAGIGMDAARPDEGRKAVTGRELDFGKFRVPSLRDVEKTGPYFHDGSAETLREAVDIMAGGGIENHHLSRIFHSIREANLTQQDRFDLVQFLKALTGDSPVVVPPLMEADALNIADSGANR